MSKILDLYTKLNTLGSRFVDETFNYDQYGEASPQLTIVDVGSLIGDYAYYCLPFAKVIYAIEPDPIPFETLKNFVKEYELEDKIKIFNIALSDHNGTVKMKFDHNGGGRFAGANDKEDEVNEVECKTLNTFLEENKIEKVDILKVDIEDGEREVFNSKDFETAVAKLNTVVGEHAGFEILRDKGFNLKTTASNLYIATK